jgi:hypothetical protein
VGAAVTDLPDFSQFSDDELLASYSRTLIEIAIMGQDDFFEVPEFTAVR